MRSHYDEYARAETKNTTTTTTATQYNKMLNTNHNYSNNNNHFTYNNNNNNNSNNNNYNNSNNNNNSNGSIPYHARENSLPFSYGQISKTSTPLRPTASASAAATTTTSSSVSRSYKNGLEHDFDFDFDFDLSSDRYNNNNANNNNDYLLGSHAKTSNGVNGARYALDANHYNPATTDRAKKRIEFLDTSNGGAGVGCTQSLRYNNNNNKSSISADEPDPSMIKVQPRLTSPLLVRKTLGSNNSSNNHNSTISRSPTRSSTNTIANTYHYSYGNKNSSGGGAGDNFDKFGLNGNISSHNNNNIYGRNTPTYAGVDTLTTTSKTPARPDFDELLRERREKVFNEYRSTTQEVLTTPPNRSPLPPPRRFINGTVQLPSTLPPNLNNGRGSSLSNYGGAQYGEMGPQVPQRSAGKYNYDFQFNLNLDERQNGVAPNDDGRPRHQTLDRSPVRYRNYHLEQRQNGVAPNNDEVDFVKSPPRHQTLDRSPQRYRSPETVRQHQTLDRFMTTHSRYQDELDSDILRRRPNLAPDAAYGQYQEKQQHQQLYETRNIPLASYNVERNYHQQQQQTATTSSSSANAPPASSSSFMSDIYATPYDDQYASNKSRPLEANTNTNNQLISSSTTTTTTIERTNRHDPTPYGNGQIYGQQQAHDGSRGQATTPQMARRRESSPIYATSTKKVTQVAATTPTSPAAAPLYRSPTPQQHTNAAASTATASMAALSITDYPAASPGGTIRPETPAFPVTPRTPFATNSGVGSSSYNTIQRHNGSVTEIQNYSTETLYGTNYRPRLNSSLSMANSEPQEVAAHLVKFAKDSSKFWYKPNLSRDEALALLLHAPPGTFVVRDSATYKNFYGLVLRVAQPPPGTPSSGRPDELVRHFLIEPTTRGVRLKDCNNEPVFTSLSALIYEHSINRLALPCLLQIPERDIVQPLVEPSPAQTQLLTQGAACNVLWLYSCDTESLTGEEAIRKAMRQMNAPGNKVTPIEVHFKVSHQGITLTDNTRKKFFRKHYTADIISFCAIDPDNRMWTMQEHDNDNTTVVGALKKTIFAFVARRSASSKDNQCHVFCDLAINQPASAIVSFVNKTLPTEKQKNYIL